MGSNSALTTDNVANWWRAIAFFAVLLAGLTLATIEVTGESPAITHQVAPTTKRKCSAPNFSIHAATIAVQNSIPALHNNL